MYIPYIIPSFALHVESAMSDDDDEIVEPILPDTALFECPVYYYSHGTYCIFIILSKHFQKHIFSTFCLLKFESCCFDRVLLNWITFNTILYSGGDVKEVFESVVTSARCTNHVWLVNKQSSSLSFINNFMYSHDQHEILTAGAIKMVSYNLFW